MLLSACKFCEFSDSQEGRDTVRITQQAQSQRVACVQVNFQGMNNQLWGSVAVAAVRTGKKGLNI